MPPDPTSPPARPNIYIKPQLDEKQAMLPYHGSRTHCSHTWSVLPMGKRDPNAFSSCKYCRSWQSTRYSIVFIICASASTALLSFSIRFTRNSGLNAISASASNTCHTRTLCHGRHHHVHAGKHARGTVHIKETISHIRSTTSRKTSPGLHLRKHWGWIWSACIGERRVDMKNRVMKICVGIRTCSRSKQAFPLATAQERDMLHKMGNALLISFLIHAPCTAR